MGKPLLFGDATLDADRIDQIRAIDDSSWDRSYIPGYGEIVRKNEHLVRDGMKPVPVGHFQWIRLSTVDGREVGDRDMLTWAMQGYTFITKDEVVKLGFGMPPTAYVDAQGRIRREDLALAYVDADQRRKNVERQVAARGVQTSDQPNADNDEIRWETRSDERGDIAALGAKHL